MFVYAIGNSEKKQKIGFTSNLKERLSTLQTGNPDSLVVHHSIEVQEDRARKLEKKIHHELNHKRIKGEWFAMSPDEVKNFLIYAEIRWLDDPLL